MERKKKDCLGDFFPPWRFNVHLKRTFHCSVCVHYTCGFVTVDIKAKPPIAPSQVVFACLHVFSAGGKWVFPSLHPRPEDRRAHGDQCLDDAIVPR